MMSFLGLTILIFGITHIDKENNYPSTWALIPVLGAILIISSGSKSWLNRTLLMNPISVWFGLISYPLYLWHWPIISIIRIQKGREISILNAFTAIVISILLAWTTYYFLERKIRNKKNNKTKTISLFILMLVLFSIGLLIYCKKISNQIPMPSFHYNTETMIHRCNQYFPKWNKINDNKCKLGAPLKSIDTVIIGDSHAGHLFEGFFEKLILKNKHAAVFPVSCQTPLLNISSAFIVKDEKLRLIREQGYKFISKALDYAAKSNEVQNIYLAHNPNYCDKSIIDIKNKNETDIEKIYRNGFYRTLKMFSGSQKNIYIVLDNPSLPYDPSLCSKRTFSFFKNKCSFTYAPSKMKKIYEKQAILVANKFKNVKIINLKNIFCNKQKCSIAPNGINLYADRNHLNYIGSKYVSNYILNTQ